MAVQVVCNSGCCQGCCQNGGTIRVNFAGASALRLSKMPNRDVYLIYTEPESGSS